MFDFSTVELRGREIIRLSKSTGANLFCKGLVMIDQNKNFRISQNDKPPENLSKKSNFGGK